MSALRRVWCFEKGRRLSWYCTLVYMNRTYYATGLLDATRDFGGPVRHELNLPGE
jgi:hypothetical protein